MTPAPSPTRHRRRRPGGRLSVGDAGRRAEDGTVHDAGGAHLLNKAGTGRRLGPDDPRRQLDAIRKARSFASCVMVTGQRTVDADVFGRVYLRLGTAARTFCPEAHAWFVEACERIGVSDSDCKIQWNSLAIITAITGVGADRVGEADFGAASQAVVDAYVARDKPESGRNMASVFHRLRLTLFHAGRLDHHRRPPRSQPVSVTGWAVVTPAYAASARRYVEQVARSLRPSTVEHIEQHLRVFGTWLAERHPEVTSCADLERHHIEAFKTWLATHPSPRTGNPLSRTSIKEQLINLHCFFDRTTEWGYPNSPRRPLIFMGDLPIIDKPLPRFLDDAAAAKLLRTARADTDPLARLVTELFARTGIRRSELLGLTVDAVVQIGSAFWLRIPVGKLHNDRYIPLHPSSRSSSTTGSPTAVPGGSARIGSLWNETGRSPAPRQPDPPRPSDRGRRRQVTPHQLRHTLATQASFNRGMSLDANGALLGQDAGDDNGLRPHRRQDRGRGVLRRHREVEALYDQPRRLHADDEGTEMRKLRAEMHRRMLGNGYCARPVEMDCHFESICESCTFFVTTIEFRPTLQRQRDDAAAKGQVGRQNVFDGLIARLDEQAS